MDKAVNGWTMLLVLALVAMGYAFGFWQTKIMLPQAAAQIAANDKVVSNVNVGYQNLIKQVNDAFKSMDGRVKALEAKK